MLSDPYYKMFNKTYGLFLPYRTDFSYTRLEKIKDYEYTYCIAYELLKRTKSFKKLFDVQVEDRGDEWISQARALGLDTHTIKSDYRPSTNSLLYEDLDSNTIADIGGGYPSGIWRLIDYYYKKNKIYKINKEYQSKSISAVEVEEDEIYDNKNDYSIPCKNLILRNDSTVLKPIDTNLRLRELEDEFLSTLTLKDITSFKGVIGKYWKKRPLVIDLEEDDNLSRLINFYTKIDKVYKIKDKNAKQLEYIKLENPNSLSILMDHSDFFIPCKVKKNNKVTYENKRISFDIALDEIYDLNLPLEERFSASIKLSEIDYVENDVSNRLTINDIHNGTRKLIQYYINREGIFPNTLIKTKIRYQHCSVKEYFRNRDIYDSILDPRKKYYIPCKKSTYSSEIKLRRISEKLSLKILEENFLKTLHKSDITNKVLQILPTYSVAELKFNESTIINLPVNINLPLKELEAYIKKIKEDYDNKNTNLKNALETIGRDLIHADKPKSIAEIETKKMKKNIADIFYIHDMLEIFLKHQEKIKREREEKISKIKQSYDDDDDIQDAINDSSYFYENEIEKYSDEKLIEEIKSLTKFSENKITVARTYINYYIKDEKYKELITGVSSEQ